MPRKPTLKQQKAVALMAENGGNASKAMRDAGYSPQTAVTPSKLTESIGFQDLLDKYIPELKLLQVHEEGLSANKVISARAIRKSGEPHDADEDTDDFVEVPDYAVRHKYLETGYHIRGKMKPDLDVTVNFIVPVIVKNAADKDTISDS